MQKKTHQKHSRHSQQRQVRIIGGIWKRTNLPVLEVLGLRPTPDRVRETVFNWMHHIFDGNWHQRTGLDLFAGTGALGFEAASRGAASITMVDRHALVMQQLTAVKTKLHAEQVNLICGDALSIVQAMTQRGQCFDMIFLDPPYQQGWLAKVWPWCTQLLTEEGVLYVEAGQPLQKEMENMPNCLAGWEIVRADQAGSVFYHLLQRKNHTEFQHFFQA